MTETDSACAAAFHPSPNHEPRALPVDFLILHYTGMASGREAEERLRDPAAKVSSHYLVHEDGRTVQLVSEQRRAWHAGAALWDGLTDINSRSIGIEIVNGGHDFGCPPFPAAQIAAVIALCRDILSRWPIPPHRVLAHSDIAPDRKRDPGEMFPWKTLHQNGVGLWVEPTPISEGRTLLPGEEGDAVRELQRRLGDYGYAVAPSGVFDQPTVDAVSAFQRHFRPARIDGAADASTRETLARLIAARNGDGASARARTSARV